MAKEKKSFASPPPPINLIAPEHPGHTGGPPPPKKRGRRPPPQMEETNSPPQAGTPMREKMPPPPPQVKPRDFPKRRKPPPLEPVRSKKPPRPPSALSRVARVIFNPMIISLVSWAIAGVAVIAIAVWVVSGMFVYNSFEVFLDGEHIGYMSIGVNENLTSEEFHETAILSLQAARAGARVRVQQTVTIQPARASNRQIDTQSDILAYLTRRFDYEIAATEIRVNGQFEALMRTPSDLNHVKFLLQERWFNEYTVGAEFVSGWEEITQYVCPEETEFWTAEQAYHRLDRTTEQVYTYTVVSGDNLERIAIRFGTSVHRIMGYNNLTSTNIFVGDELTILTYLPLLTVRTFDEIPSMEHIVMPLDSTYTSELPQAVTNVIQEGRAGQQEIITRVTRENGVERHREVIEGEIIIEPITHIIEVGIGAAAMERR